MSSAQELFKHATVAISHGTRIHWGNRGAASFPATGRFQPSLTPLPREMLEAGGFTIPAEFPEGEWQGAVLGDVLGSENGRRVFHLTFLHVHNRIDLCGANIAEAMWRAFNLGGDPASEITLYTLREAHRDMEVALSKGRIA